MTRPTGDDKTPRHGRRANRRPSRAGFSKPVVVVAVALLALGALFVYTALTAFEPQRRHVAVLKDCALPIGKLKTVPLEDVEVVASGYRGREPTCLALGTIPDGQSFTDWAAARQMLVNPLDSVRSITLSDGRECFPQLQPADFLPAEVEQQSYHDGMEFILLADRQRVLVRYVGPDTRWFD